MSLLATITGTYSWATFSEILNNPERLEAWLKEKLGTPEPEWYLDPEDPAAVELSELSADQESEAMEFLGELNPAEKAALKAAMVKLWGQAGAASLPY